MSRPHRLPRILSGTWFRIFCGWARLDSADPWRWSATCTVTWWKGDAWIREAQYKEGLTLAQLMPGPLAAQLSIYLGYVHYSVLGATLVGIAFVLPSFLMVLAIGWAYVLYGGLPWMQAVFYGVGPSVIGIIALSAYKLTRQNDWSRWSVVADLSDQRGCYRHY